MGMIQILTKLQNAMEAKQNTVFTVPVEKQQKYLAHFPEPRDDLERGYYQYRCQTMMQGRWVSALVSAASFPVTLLMLVKNRRAALPQKEPFAENRAVLFRDGKPDNIMPRVLREEFSECITDPIEGAVLRKEDVKLIWELIRRYPLSWQFVLKCTIKIARYRYAMEKYAPKALVVCNEYSYTSSVLMEFCSRNNVELVNVMHGEKVYNIRDSFFHFSRCYVWDECYVDLLTRLRAEPSQFLIALPPSLIFRETCSEKVIDYTYFLGAEDGEALNKVAECLKRLTEKEKRVAIRPHPRYSNLEHVCAAIGEENIIIEDTNNLTVEQSVLRTHNAVSLYSTVLNQAYHNGTHVVIDDVSNPDLYRKLNEIEYVMLHLDHSLLSTEIKK